MMSPGQTEMGPSPLYGASCEKMQKIRDGPGVRDPQGGRKSGFSGRKPAGDLAPTCPDHLVSFSARKADIQPCSLTIFIFVCVFCQKTNMKIMGGSARTRAGGSAR